jgi:hypothetical protein
MVFTMAFFQVWWDVIKEDVTRVFHDFHAKGKFEQKKTQISYKLVCVKLLQTNL